ncbi:MAG: response regulator, partial [Desulfofustis sp.]|nr:response regulator [Desulfofustis sp.]
VDISSIVKEALKLLRAVIPAGIEIDTQVPSGLGRVKTDPTRIHQVMMNLCANATQAMESGSGLIRVVLEKIARSDFPSDLVEIDTDHCFCLSVTDTGVGIPAEVLPRIFDPYFTTKQKGEGTGLGLAVVHGIISRSGGTIRVFSEPGRGSSFRLYFPAAPSSSNHERQLPTDTMPRGSERILFVDDEASLAEVAREMLIRLGYQVDTYTSSVEALAHLRDHPDLYQLLITDQTMPVLSGIDFARQVLAVQPQLPVVLYTGYSSAIDGPDARQLGIKAFLMKPLSMTRLATVVRQVLDG